MFDDILEDKDSDVEKTIKNIVVSKDDLIKTLKDNVENKQEIITSLIDYITELERQLENKNNSIYLISYKKTP